MGNKKGERGAFKGQQSGPKCWQMFGNLAVEEGPLGAWGHPLGLTLGRGPHLPTPLSAAALHPRITDQPFSHPSDPGGRLRSPGTGCDLPDFGGQLWKPRNSLPVAAEFPYFAMEATFCLQ